MLAVRLLILTLIGLGVGLGVGVLKLSEQRHTIPAITITRGYGIVSPCGYYDFVIVWSDGTSEVYNQGHPLPEQYRAILEDNPALFSAIVVPCPNGAQQQSSPHRKSGPATRDLRI